LYFLLGLCTTFSYVLSAFAFFCVVIAPTDIYSISLHDALPISTRTKHIREHGRIYRQNKLLAWAAANTPSARNPRGVPVACEARSEEHTSELQSRENLVCRLLLEKKKQSISLAFLKRHLGPLQA